MRNAASAAEQGLYDLNVQTGEAIVTPEYARLLGYEPEEFTETNARWIERLHPDEREIVAEAYRAYVAGETPEYRVEFRQRTKAGEWKWILSIGKIVQYDASGRPLRMLGTHTDITQRKEAEEERARLTAQLLHAQKMESVGRLAGGVAHDFNNMLLVILAFTELAKKGRQGDSELLRSMEEIERAALRAREVTRQLLAVSRKQIAAPRTLNLSAILTETRKTLGLLLGEDIDLSFHLGGDLVAAREDTSVELLLTDVVMPELSGKELCERLRAVRPRLRVLYMSGYTADVIAHHDILEDGVHFIQKPFTMDDLARAIRTALGGRV